MRLGWDCRGGQRKEIVHHSTDGEQEMPKGLVDTASACSLIWRWLVKPHWLVPGASVRTEYVPGDKKCCPVAEVTLKVCGRFNWKRVRGAGRLPQPVVLLSSYQSLFPLQKQRGVGGSDRET